MKILDRYVFKEILFPTLIALIALTFVALLAFTREIGSLLEAIVRQSATMSDVWAISVAILPNVLTFTIPMAMLVGILTGFGRMSSDSESVAFRAAGVSMTRLLVPVLLLAIPALAADIGLSVWIAPRTAAHLRDLKYDLAVKQVSLELKPRVFNESPTNLILYVEDVATEGTTWRGIMLADMNKPEETRVTFARSGTLGRDDEHRAFQLTLTDGSTHVVSPLSPSRYSFSTFPTTTFSIPMPEAPPKPAKPTISETSTRTLLNNIQTGTATSAERSEFQRRVALPFACLAFAIVGLPLGVSTTRGSKSMGLVLSLTLMMVYYLAFIGGTRIADNAQFSPFFGAWLPNLVFALLGMILIARSDHESENQAVAALASVMLWFSDML